MDGWGEGGLASSAPHINETGRHKWMKCVNRGSKQRKYLGMGAHMLLGTVLLLHQGYNTHRVLHRGMSLQQKVCTNAQK